MKNFIYVFLAFALVSCAKSGVVPSSFHAGDVQNAIPGIVYVKVSEKLAKELDRPLTDVRSSSEEIPDELFRALQNLDATTVEPLFPKDSRFKERRTKYGLDRWFRIKFDKTKDLKKAGELLKGVSGIETIEPAYTVSLAGDPGFTCQSSVKYNVVRPSASENLPFNDPLLPRQWYLNNDGKNNPKSVKGADINVFKAWEITTGNPKVVVAVLDEPIDYMHEDLEQSMWINQAELNGKPGEDDDDNGYVDDIYGYNFTGTPSIDGAQFAFGLRQHGTHVAGIIGARTNNGIGMSGIAGGDGTPDSGIRIMALQTIGPNKESGHIAEAFYYAANNGAVIANNSWKVERLGSYLKQAIDYFIDNAGCDENGNQLPGSLMKGGIAFFASGNDGSRDIVYPASYGRVFAVTSAGLTLKRASYANVAGYVQMTAFGGDPIFDGANADIISTVPHFEEVDGRRRPVSYEPYLPKSGTSQATPQVAGVAALALSVHGGEGFTPDKLKKILLTSIRPFNVDEYNPQDKGLMGVGYIDAYKAVKLNKNIAPVSSELKFKDNSANSITVEWEVGRDEDDETPFVYNLYYSTTPITENGLSQASKVRLPVGGLSVGSKMNHTLSSLKGETKYYMALQAEDRWGLTSDMTFLTHHTHNSAPKVEGIPTTPVEVSPMKGAVVRLRISDKDGHLWTYRMDKIQGITVKRTDEGLFMNITASLPEKENDVTIYVSDEIGAVTVVKFKVLMNEHHGNSENSTLRDIDVYMTDLVKGIHLGDYFGYSYKENSYKVTTSSDGIINAEIEGELLKIKPLKEGEVKLNITALKSDGSAHTEILTINVRKKSHVMGSVANPIKGIGKRVVNRYLEVYFSKEISSFSYVIYDRNGRNVFAGSVTDVADGRSVLDLEALLPGKYNIQIKADGFVLSESLIKR